MGKEKIATHEVEVNLFYMHYQDASHFAGMACQEKSKLKSLYARHAVLSVVFASEALINRVLGANIDSDAVAKSIEKLSIIDKWSLSPLLLSEDKKKAEIWFDTSKEPFQSFAELIKIRNWLVHPKSREYVEATHDVESTITDLQTNEELPWVDVLKGNVWPQTRIPFNPFELTNEHAQKAIGILDKMIQELRDVLTSKIHEKWLSEIGLRSKEDGSMVKITVNSLWGGYTPD